MKKISYILVILIIATKCYNYKDYEKPEVWKFYSYQGN